MKRLLVIVGAVLGVFVGLPVVGLFVALWLMPARPASAPPTRPAVATPMPPPSILKNFGRPLGQPAPARVTVSPVDARIRAMQTAADRAAALERARNQPHDDWHPVDATNEVKWIADDFFSHVGGHCYARARNGSTQTSSGAPGLVRVGEKYCIAAGAKDTPFEVPDQR